MRTRHFEKGIADSLIFVNIPTSQNSTAHSGHKEAGGESQLSHLQMNCFLALFGRGKHICLGLA